MELFKAKKEMSLINFLLDELPGAGALTFFGGQGMVKNYSKVVGARGTGLQCGWPSSGGASSSSSGGGPTAITEGDGKADEKDDEDPQGTKVTASLNLGVTSSF